ncbi:hypothetical protein [Mesorhizobium sp. ES1-4]|uniref:hypothetical protein n=1 Tax=Mesorhizobium sp. ES1-4 TaxID=2876627 RepID=UPI001CCFFDA1|nr:hypothetical protein [Mesorhizobium sp. ES1-4]MBZ9794698.1 hypothetical protein [Mesorhizobium sp. ES1-4]
MGLFVIAGEEVGFDEILFAFLKSAKPLDKIRLPGETTPAAGGGAAGAVLVVNPWEEDKG